MTLLAELRSICGERHAAPAEPQHALLGRQPRWTVAPSSTAEIAAVLRLASAHQLPTVVRGSGSKLHWGPAPDAVDLLLDLRRLSGVVAYQPSERRATVRAGSRLDTLASVFAERGCRLALDPPGDATVGGAISTDAAGPLRARHGAARNLMTDLTLVRGDGEVCRASQAATGIPGYDVGALANGGFGGFGVITEVTFRLHPLPAARRWVVRSVSSPAEVRQLISSVLSRYPRPAAVEVYHPYGPHEGPDQLGVLLEGPPQEVALWAAALAIRFSDGEVVVADEPPAWWGRYPFRPDDVALRISASASDMYALSYVIKDAAGDVPVRTRWSPEVAVMHAALPGGIDPGRLIQLVEGVRQTLIARQGCCVVLHAPDGVRERLDMWGPQPGVELLRRARNKYDPKHVLAPGRHPADR